MKRIDSLQELKLEAAYSKAHPFGAFFILIAGDLRNGKNITWYAGTNTFTVHNEIDDSYKEDLTEEQLAKETSIVLAIERGVFYKYE